ncbi:hypothetical protein Z969_10465 [Clostridium novyi A str. 4570]|uniref:Uncharacterized protein n=1 Tax=Clostridium novyi A str. 4570 TaxID=1444290 RepID=A0AA88ZKA6_CLONO|nr:2'-5' RNA ligase family protein [Clostridium novyi]KGM99747.1 hypothetical protein Z969_10465 [Clostridium novyi A str. 4570]
MRYYLVALFDNEDYKKIEKIQKSIAKEYNIYNSLPMLHITLEVIDNPDVDKLEKVIRKILEPYKKFKVQISGVICFEPPYKSVNLKVEGKGYINRLCRNINDTLKLYGFRVRKNIENWDIHISLANTNFSSREWSYDEYSTACSNLKQDKVCEMITINKIELWKPINDKKRMVVKSIPLKDF